MMVRFADIDAIKRHLRFIHAPFGPLSDGQWVALARYSARVLPDGRFTMHDDPRIADPFRGSNAVDVDRWALWERTWMPRLVIRGETSDLLSRETVAHRVESGAVAYEAARTGQAPALVDPVQIDVIRSLLAS